MSVFEAHRVWSAGLKQEVEVESKGVFTKMPISRAGQSIVLASLCIILILNGIVRYRLIDVPLERDEGEYAYAGQLILRGIPPYQAVYNMKLPGIYAAYALSLALFGQTQQGIHLALLCLNSATIIILFLLTRLIVGPLAALIAAASFALFSLSHTVHGTVANAEHFVIFFAISGLYFFIKSMQKDAPKLLFLSGVLLGLGTLMKQHGITFFCVVLIYLIVSAIQFRPVEWRTLIVRMLIVNAGLFSVLLSLVLTMYWAGVFEKFWFWTVHYSSTYVSQISPSSALHLFMKNFGPIFNAAPLLWILAGSGCFIIFLKHIDARYKSFLYLLICFSVLSICPGFYFRPHYFLLLLPCVSILCGITISFFYRFFCRYSTKIVCIGIPLLLFSMSLFQIVVKHREIWFHMTPFQISRTIFGANPFPESLKIAQYLMKNTTADDRIAVLGSEPQIFFYSHRRSASSYIYMYPLMENHPFSVQMNKEFIKDMETKKPAYLLYVNVPTSWLRRSDSSTLIFQWFKAFLQEKRPKLVGTIELFDDDAVYHWDKNVTEPKHSPLWIAVFQL